MNKRIAILMMIQVFIYLGFGIIIPVMPEIIVQLQVSSVHLGGLLSVYSLASFLTAPIWGSLSDRYGRKSLILIGLAGYTVSFLLFGFLIDHLMGLYAARMMSGLFSGALYAATISYVADQTSPENRTKYMGYIGISIGLGFIFGPSIGGLLSGYGLSVPFYCSAAMLSLLFVLSWVLLPESHIRSDQNAAMRMQPGEQWKWVKGSQMFPLLSFTFIATLLMAGLESTFQLFEIEKIGITPVQVGLLFMISGLVDALVQGVIIPSIKHGQESRWIIGGQLVAGFALLMIPFGTELWMVGMILALFTAGNALVRTCVVSLITIHAGNQQGLASGVSYSLDSLGRIIGPLIFTWMLGVHSTATFLILSIITFISIALMTFYEKSRRLNQQINATH